MPTLIDDSVAVYQFGSLKDMDLDPKAGKKCVYFLQIFLFRNVASRMCIKGVYDHMKFGRIVRGDVNLPDSVSTCSCLPTRTGTVCAFRPYLVFEQNCSGVITKMSAVKKSLYRRISSFGYLGDSNLMNYNLIYPSALRINHSIAGRRNRSIV